MSTGAMVGGFWEAGVKRIKYHIKRALDTSLLAYEEFARVLTEVEPVNSRPICIYSYISWLANH